MAIYRGTGGASDSTDDSTISAVTTQAGIATTKASEAASSATDANTSATNAAASATAASGHASTSSDNATASSGSATDAAGFATAASNSATAASTSATAAANSASIANSAEVQAVAAKTTEITGVYNDIANVNTVAGNIADVNTVATNSSNITAVAGDASDIGTVATSISNVNTVGDNIASVNAVASNNTNINTVAADASDIGTVAGISGNVTTVAGISSDVTTVAGLESKMDTVIADASDIGTVAGNIGDVSTVAGISSDVDTVAGISADVTSVADNMADVQNATTSATNAATSAVSASDSASAASTSAGSASSSASSASTSATNASNSATAASNSATAASSSASAASGSASAASGSASAAASSASAASTSASNAATSETNAASSASAAATSATNAATSETNAAASAADSSNAASTWSNYYNTYVGASSSEPTVDVQGNALVAGALYFNTTNNTTYVWTGSAWNAVANNNIINPNVALTQDLATNGNDVKFGDNDKATFGTGDDLQIYHDGSNSVISDGGTGSLLLRGSNVWIQNADGTETGARFITDGAIDLRHNNSIKLATTSTGIDVTGDVSIGDGSASATRLLMGSGDDSKMFHNGIDTYWINDTGNIIIRNQSDDKDILFQTDDGSGGTTTYITVDGSETDVSLHYGGAQKLATTSTGIDVTGTATMNGLTVSAPSVTATINATATNSGLQFTHGSTNSSVRNWSIRSNTEVFGDFVIRRESAYNSGIDTKSMAFASNGDISFYEDTGTTPKLFWDASAESLGIGTSSPNVSGFNTALTVDGAESGIELTEGGTVQGIVSSNSKGLGLSGIGSRGIRLFTSASGAAAERLRIDSSGNVGIGTNDPTVASGNGLAIYDSVVPRVQLRNSTSGDSSGDGAGIFMSGSDLGIENRESSNIIFYNNTEKARIDASGNLLVGTTAVAAGVANTIIGHSIAKTGYATHSRTSGTPLFLNRNTSNGDIVDFRKDGTTVGSIGSVVGQYLRIGSGDVGVMFQDGSDAIEPRTTDDANRDDAISLGAATNRFKDLYLSGGVKSTSSIYMGRTDLNTSLWIGNSTVNAGTSDGNARDNAVDLGYSGSRWKDLYLAGGVYLGGTGAANKLDDYEEGNWTPVFADASTGGNVATVGASLGSYTKVGNLVTVGCNLSDIDITGLTSSNALYIRGLPFTVGTTQTRIGSAFLDRVTFSGYVTAYATGSHVLLFNTSTGAFDAALLVSSIDGVGSDVFFTVQYQV